MYENTTLQEYAKKKDRGSITSLMMVDAKCICGKVRQVSVPPGDFEPVRIAEQPCDCGRFMCIITTKTVRPSTIDILLEN